MHKMHMPRVPRTWSRALNAAARRPCGARQPPAAPSTPTFHGASIATTGVRARRDARRRHGHRRVGTDSASARRHREAQAACCEPLRLSNAAPADDPRHHRHLRFAAHRLQRLCTVPRPPPRGASVCRHGKPPATGRGAMARHGALLSMTLAKSDDSN